MVVMLKQISPKGTVRSTARRSRLRAWGDAEHLAGIGEGLLDAPPERIASYHVFGGGEEVGGDEGEPVAAIIAVSGAGCVVADQNDPDGAGVE
jgi:hypothetical protein